jgi:hypothetical protein
MSSGSLNSNPFPIGVFVSIYCLSRVARTAGVALLPAVVVLCCTGRASAECGDYVRLLGPDGRVQTPADHDPMPGERPCHGPNCQGAPKAPLPVPPAPTHAPDTKGLVVGDASQAGNDSTNHFPTESDGSPVRLPTSIFHPPRA